MTRDADAVTTCSASGASLYQRSQTGRYRSGQTGQTVNLLALRLRWFDSSPAQTFADAQARVSFSPLLMSFFRGTTHTRFRGTVLRSARRCAAASGFATRFRRSSPASAARFTDLAFAGFLGR